MGGAYSMHGGGEKRVQNVDRKTCREDTTLKNWE
jgi:hypothetical protein